jgi:hypothetical protein
MACYCDTCLEGRRKWREANRARINEKKRLNRAKKRLATTQHKCLLCEMLMRGRNQGTRVYCTDCLKRFPNKVNADKCRRYYQRKLAKETLSPASSEKSVNSVG